MNQVSDVLDQLGDDGAVLMMYLADELSADDRARVERRLDADAGLRDRLEVLREAQDQFFAAMPVLDGATRLAAPESVGVRRVTAAVRQWQAARLARPAPVPAAAPSRMPRWAYAAATAAAAVIAFVVWWGNSDGGDPRVAEAPARRRAGPSERPAMFDLVAMLMRETSGPIEAPEEVASLIEPSDYAILTPIMSEPEPAPSQQPARTEPAEHESEQDDWFLL
jgi:anti-sigma factor RsiW